MRNLISVAVILHVAFTVAGLKLRGKEVEIGDMIAFPVQCVLGVRYQHYAVFVGDRYGSLGNIFEHQKANWYRFPDCIFSTLESSEDHYVFNFLDGYKGTTGKVYKKGSVARIMARVEVRRANCEWYGPFCNNCEHLATYVRYGERISLQFNLTAQNSCDIPEHENREDMWKYVNELGRQDNAASSIG